MEKNVCLKKATKDSDIQQIFEQDDLLYSTVVYRAAELNEIDQTLKMILVRVGSSSNSITE